MSVCALCGAALQGVLGVSASLTFAGYDPREEFKAMFIDASAAYMEAAQARCQRALQDFEAAEAAAKQEARKSGLIKVGASCGGCGPLFF